LKQRDYLKRISMKNKSGNRPTVAVLTGGGDVPGLNACIKALVYRAASEGMRILGIRRGWSGLLHYNPDDPGSFSNCVEELVPGHVRTIDRSGGTYLHTSRTNPSAVSPKETPSFLKKRSKKKCGVKDFTSHILKNLEQLSVDAIIPIGGDDTLSFGERLHREGFPVIAIPKTMDNDVFGTDYCIGFSTAVTRGVSFIHALRTCTGSHERIAVIELFGRYCGETSLISAYLAGVDRAIISEVPFDPKKLADLVMKDKKDNPKNYAMITISEGAKMTGGDMLQSGEADAYGHRRLGGIGEETGAILKELTGENVLNQRISYLMRSGAPDSLDLMVAVNFANMAIDLFMKGTFGRLIALCRGIYTDIPLSTITTGQKRVDVRELYDVEEYRPKVRHVSGKPMFLY
jgi:ATP-dependent phosphofructokinase / diphosphate-dependent phosphofructokinase